MSYPNKFTETITLDSKSESAQFLNGHGKREFSGRHKLTKAADTTVYFTAKTVEISPGWKNTDYKIEFLSEPIWVLGEGNRKGSYEHEELFQPRWEFYNLHQTLTQEEAVFLSLGVNQSACTALFDDVKSGKIGGVQTFEVMVLRITYNMRLAYVIANMDVFRANDGRIDRVKFYSWANSFEAGGPSIPKEFNEFTLATPPTKNTPKPSVVKLHALSAFQSMKKLAFNEITMKFDPDSLAIRVDAREKRATVSLSDLGLTKKGGVILNRQGEFFLGMQKQPINIKDGSTKRALKRLSTALRNAFDTTDTPIVKGVSQFKLTIPKENEAKRMAEKVTGTYDENRHSSNGNDANSFFKETDPNYNSSDPMYFDDPDLSAGD